MKEIYPNINIIGGGLIGVAAAYSLSKLGFKITILEKNPPYNLNKNDTDQSTIAISEGTKNFLENIGIWKEIKPLAEPIKQIKIVDRKISNSLDFDNKRRFSNLGYIVKNKHVLDIFYKKLKKNKKVKIFNNANIIKIENQKERIITETKNLKIFSELNIAADGKKSFIKKIHKTPFFKKEYKKKALVIQCTHSKNHFGTAFELFYKNGPLAILPMKKQGRKFASSIVWTNDSEYLDSLLDMDKIKLKFILNESTILSVGQITSVDNMQLFPLSAHINTKFYERRTLYVGDSAHSFHPIAGQGWNLGMNDIKNLFFLSKKYLSLGIELGDSFFCKEFHNENFYNAYRLYQITDKLDSIFRIQNPLISIGRKSALNYIQRNKKVKNKISDFAMGIN